MTDPATSDDALAKRLMQESHEAYGGILAFEEVIALLSIRNGDGHLTRDIARVQELRDEREAEYYSLRDQWIEVFTRAVTRPLTLAK